MSALLGQAQKALEAGDWSTVKASFEAALEQQESAEALAGLGNVLWWLGQTDASVRCLEHAYAAFRRRPEPDQAALAAIYLCLLYRASLGNFAASRGWLGRAARLVDEFELVPLRGWVLLCRSVACNDEDDPVAGERWAREACQVARESADGDLELCALSELGAALVAMGSVEAGVALLDEAMAGSVGGETQSLDTVVLTSCNTVISCSRAGDFKRANQWIRAADEFNQRYGSSAGMSAIYVAVPDADAAYERAKAAGAQVTELVDRDYGSREFTATDPDGNRWSLGTYRGPANGG